MDLNALESEQEGSQEGKGVGREGTYFWSSICPGLHIRRMMVCNEEARPKINDLHFAPAEALDENIFRLYVTMYDPEAMDEIEGLQTLPYNVNTAGITTHTVASRSKNTSGLRTLRWSADG